MSNKVNTKFYWGIDRAIQLLMELRNDDYNTARITALSVSNKELYAYLKSNSYSWNSSNWIKD